MSQQSRPSRSKLLMFTEEARHEVATLLKVGDISKFDLDVFNAAANSPKLSLSDLAKATGEPEFKIKLAYSKVRVGLKGLDIEIPKLF
jgi:hypothetical protein